jgi:hypothetical protein
MSFSFFILQLGQQREKLNPNSGNPPPPDLWIGHVTDRDHLELKAMTDQGRDSPNS